MQQATDFLEESEVLYALVANLSDEECQQPTAFKGWTINNVLRHLHLWNQAAALSISGRFAPFMELVNRAFDEGTALTDFEENYLDALSGVELIATWKSGFVELAEKFSEIDPKRRLEWSGPTMSARSSVTARHMETWAHGQEVFDQLGVIRVNHDRIRNIVMLGVNTFGWTYAVRDQEPPGPLPYLRLYAPSGDIWEYGDPTSPASIEGLAEEFCMVVTQTRNIADTSLELAGETAIDWMSKAQCFAGEASDPPAPGSRTINSGV